MNHLHNEFLVATWPSQHIQSLRKEMQTEKQCKQKTR